VGALKERKDMGIPNCWTVALLIAFAICTGASGQDKRLGPQDPAELETFIDGLMVAHLEAYHSAGAAVSVVKNGELLFSKGYGYADVEAKKAVDAGNTLFRIGSTSKLFVWTAVMQLVEQGRLDLNEDINNYLKGFQIPARFDAPITMAHLMTHSPGFEDHVVGLFGRDAASLAPLEEILAEQIPLRVRPPGVFSSYSNHGTGMAMYVVECITGTPWEKYLEDHILDPLGMSHTTFTQPIPDRLAPDMSKGYSYQDDKFKEEGFEYVPLAPVGAAASTADDMAQFMIAHLRLGEYQGVRILEESTARQMQGELFRHAENVSPMAHGFITTSLNGQKVVGHGGDTFWFHTMLALLPEHDLGIFVSHNTDTGGEARTQLIEQFMDRYYPAPDTPDPEPPADFEERVSRFVGRYRPNRYSHTSIAKLVAAMTLEVKDSEDGALLMEDKRLVETAPLTFRQEDGKRTVLFRKDDDGEIAHMFWSDLPIIVFEKVPTLERSAFQAGLLVVAALVFLATVILWPLAAIIRHHYGVSLPAEARLPRGAKLVAWGASVLFLSFLAFFGASLAMDFNQIAYGPWPGLYWMLSLPLIGAVLVVGAIIYTWLIWAKGKGRPFGRIHYTVLTLAFVSFLGQLHYWNLLGFRF
jgi:CubicO group peptidase (beta-lactamase class C family)